MGLLKNLKYWLTPLENDRSGSWNPNLYIRPKIRNSFLGSAHKKKNLYVRALSGLSPSLLTSENSDGLRLFVARHSQIKL
jgi:hypothetical protein